MTMIPSRCALVHLVLFAFSIAAVFAPSVSQAEVFIGAGIAAFDAPGNRDSASKGFEFNAGLALRPWVAIEGGVLQQEGERNYGEIPVDLSEYEWRALYAGPRLSHTFGGRWHLQAGLALAHVSLERETFGTLFQDGFPVEYYDEGVFRDASWGALARLGLAVDLTPRQRLSLDYRRLHAGLDQGCQFFQDDSGNGLRCELLRYRSTDGVSLAWSVQLD